MTRTKRTKTEVPKDPKVAAVRQPREARRHPAKACRRHSRCWPRRAAVAAERQVQKTARRNQVSRMEAPVSARQRMTDSALGGRVWRRRRALAGCYVGVAAVRSQAPRAGAGA